MASERIPDNFDELERKSNDHQNDVLNSSVEDHGVFEQINNNIGNRQVKNVAILMSEDSSVILTSSIPRSIQTLNPTIVPSVPLYAVSPSDQEVTAMDVDINEKSSLTNIRKLKVTFYCDSDIEHIEDIKIMKKISPIMRKNRKLYKLSKQQSVPLSKQKNAKVCREIDGFATKVPHAVKSLQDWNSKEDGELPLNSRRRMDNHETNTQTEGYGELQDGSLHREDNPQLITQTPALASNSVEDQLSIGDQVPSLNIKGSPKTSKTASNIGQRSQVVNKLSCRPQIILTSVNGNPKQSLGRPAENLSEKAVQSRPNTNQPQGQLQDWPHDVTTKRFPHLARLGFTVTPVKSSAKNTDSNVSGSAETARRAHRSQGNEPFNQRGQGNEPFNQRGNGSVDQQGNLSENAIVSHLNTDHCPGSSVESRPDTNQPPGKSPANHQVKERTHEVTTTCFPHLARHGITVTTVRSSASDSNGSGYIETAGHLHRSQRNEPVNHRSDGAIGQQGNLSVKIGSGDIAVRNGGVITEMKCTDVEISGRADDVLKLVSKFTPSFGAL